MDQVLLRKITVTLQKAGEKGMSLRELISACHTSPKRRREFNECLRHLEKKGVIIDRGVRLYHHDSIQTREAMVTRLNKTYGFAKFTDDETEVFIPGRYFMGALPGDLVLVAPLAPRPGRPEGSIPEGEIIKVVKEGLSGFTATLFRDENGWFLRPDAMIRCDFPIDRSQLGQAKEGDKVLCAIVKRGSSHSAHTVRITSTYGDAQTAVNCAQAYLDLSGVPQAFTDEARQQAEFLSERGLRETDRNGRYDLREELIFTIDGADTKDIDDAISIRRSDDGYELGVHIADVSHYVKQGSPLDSDAFERGTSIYFADRVIPMLPKELSNGICSLNPGEDRLAFSCLMQISAEGELGDFHFKKSVIRSRVKGVYSEINAILAHEETEELRQKYDGLYDSIFLMKELADILTICKRKRGAPEIETSESYILLDENSKAVGIIPRTRGAGEILIEEFMLMANEAAATYARSLGLPFVYRVHEPPAPDRIENLRAVLSALGIDTKKAKTGMPASVLAGLLTAAKGKPFYPVVNNIVLRSMAKAKYFEQPIGHYGLALQNYAQFTSPIRRYPDLMIHRVLSEIVGGTPYGKIKARFEEAVKLTARQSTETELNAMMLERNCDDCYKAEYMRAHLGEEFDGVVSSVAPHGLYVELANSAEGLLKVDNLPEGQYEYDGLLEYRDLLSGRKYRVGDVIRVKCIGADVSSGKVDFCAAGLSEH